MVVRGTFKEVGLLLDDEANKYLHDPTNPLSLSYLTAENDRQVRARLELGQVIEDNNKNSLS